MELKMENLGADLNITPKLLGLQDIKIDEITITSSGDIHIKVSSTQKSVLCRQCQSPTNAYGRGRPLCLRHLPAL